MMNRFCDPSRNFIKYEAVPFIFQESSSEYKCYQQILNCEMINFYKDRFSVKCIFNKKGKYKLELFGNKDGGPKTYNILTYIVLVEQNIKRELEFPKYFNESKQIKIVEPLYNNIKSGDKVKFKIKSHLDKIIIVDEQWYYLDKGENVILVIDIQGALSIKDMLPDTLFIFILPPTMRELKKRLEGRNTETHEKVVERFKKAYEEINEVTKYNYVVINDEVDNAALKVKSILIAEHSRVDRIEQVFLNNPEEEMHEILLEDEKTFINKKSKIK